LGIIQQVTTQTLGREPPARRFVIASSGSADGPAQALVEYLRRAGAEAVVHLTHPLGAEDGDRHVSSTWLADGSRKRRVRHRPSRPPLTYPLDLTAPLLPPATEVWVGFNCLVAAQGLALRAAGRARQVVYWCVDFVPDRFGPGTATRAYDALDRLCCVKADLRVELSDAARDGRSARHDLASSAAPTVIAPMGAWLDRVPVAGVENLSAPRVVYLGHLVERQGVATLIRALHVLHDAGTPLDADIIGRGPEQPALQALAASLGVADRIHFHGFVADHREVEQILAGAAVAAAPYATAGESFSRFADPGKLKAYVAAGLPVVLTDVPPNAKELASRAGAMLVDDDPAALAQSLHAAVQDPASWAQRSALARAYAEDFDWSVTFSRVLAHLAH
jgi:glycosyltransferase involved in cell wall biosynthesis